jgi:hypothetical protein
MFALPACGFVVALNLDWPGDANPGGGFVEPLTQKDEVHEDQRSGPR